MTGHLEVTRWPTNSEMIQALFEIHVDGPMRRRTRDLPDSELHVPELEGRWEIEPMNDTTDRSVSDA